MQLAVITMRQVAVLFFMIAAGFACTRLGVVKKQAKEGFSDLLVGLVVPCMVINSYLTPFDPQTLRNLIMAYGLSAVLLAAGGVISFLFTLRADPANRPILRFACTYSNAAYMGFPLISVLFGSEGLLYASAFVTVFNILLWTQGVLMLQGARLNLRQTVRTIVTTPVLLAVAAGLILYLSQAPVPELIRTPLEMISNMNTPLSMFITGMMIAESDLKKLFSRRGLASAILIRLAARRMLYSLPAFRSQRHGSPGCSPSGGMPLRRHYFCIRHTLRLQPRAGGRRCGGKHSFQHYHPAPVRPASFRRLNVLCKSN